MNEPADARIHLISDGTKHAGFCPDTLIAMPLEDDEFTALQALLGGNDGRIEAETLGASLSGVDSPGMSCERCEADLPETRTDVPVRRGCDPDDTRLHRLVLHVTHDCNLRCKYCYADGGSYGGTRDDMSREIALSAVNWTVQEWGGVKSVQFFGGEPLLNPRLIIQVCEYFRALEDAGDIQEMPDFSVVTNGVLGDDRMVQMLNRYDIAATVSIDGPEEIHDALRGEGTFEQADEFVHRCREAGVDIDFECTWTPEHRKRGISVVDVIDFVHDRYGQDVLHVAPVSAATDSELYLDPAARQNAYAEAARYSVQTMAEGDLRANSFSWRVLEALRTREPLGLYCPAGTATIAVDASGGIYPCFMFAGDERFRMAQLSENRLVAERGADVAGAVQSCDKTVHEQCKNCWAAPVCSGCIGSDFLACGDATARTSCETIRAIAENVILEAAHC